MLKNHKLFSDYLLIFSILVLIFTSILIIPNKVKADIDPDYCYDCSPINGCVMGTDWKKCTEVNQGGQVYSCKGEKPC